MGSNDKSSRNFNREDPLWKLLLPQRLTTEELKESLTKHCISIRGQEDDRMALLKLYDSHVCPKPQAGAKLKRKHDSNSTSTSTSRDSSPSKKFKLSSETDSKQSAESSDSKPTNHKRARIQFP